MKLTRLLTPEEGFILYNTKTEEYATAVYLAEYADENDYIEQPYSEYEQWKKQIDEQHNNEINALNYGK